MSLRRLRLPACAATLSALALSGCAEENPRLLPREDADALVASIEEVEAAVSEGECGQAITEVAEARGQVDRLPDEVADSLENRLRQGIQHIESRIPVDCQAEPEITPEPTPTPEPEPEPTPEATPTPTPTPTAPPEETPAGEEVEPEGGDGVSGGEEAPEE